MREVHFDAEQVRDRLVAAGYDGPFLFELGLDAEKKPYDPETVVSAWRALEG